MRTTLTSILTATMCIASASIALAHGGGLNAEGCHNDRKNGGYHCHRAQTRSADLPKPPTQEPGKASNPFAMDRVKGLTPPTDGSVSVPMSVCQEIFKTDPNWMDDAEKRNTVAKCR